MDPKLQPFNDMVEIMRDFSNAMKEQGLLVLMGNLVVRSKDYLLGEDVGPLDYPCNFVLSGYPDGSVVIGWEHDVMPRKRELDVPYEAVIRRKDTGEEVDRVTVTFLEHA